MTKKNWLSRAFGFQAPAPATMPGLADNSQRSGWAQPFYLYNGNLYGSAAVSEYEVVTQEGMLSLPAVDRCLTLISNAVGMMLASGHVYTATGVEIPKPEVLAYPNRLYGSPFEFYSEMVATLLIYGNWLAIKVDNQLVPIHPSQVTCITGDDGYPTYRIGDLTLTYDDVLHIRGFTLPGSWWGIGVIEKQRLALSGSINMAKYARSTYRTGAVPTAVVTLGTKHADDSILQELNQSWQETFGNGARKPVFIADGMSITPLSWSPEDAEFLESRKFNIAEIALMFGLDPSDLSASVSSGTTQTYGNIGQRNLERVKFSYGPWMIRVEQAVSNRLLSNGDYFIGNPEYLLRMDTQTRYEAYKVATEMGLMNVAEIRELEGLPPLNPPQGTDNVN